LPALSVLIASFNSKATIGKCLSSLLAQKTRQPFEVIVADSSHDDTPAMVAKHFPQVRLLRLQGRHYAGSARNAALAFARGPIVALVDADCTVPDDWVERILAAHQSSPSLAIGSAIDNSARSGMIGWASYFCEFSRWMPCGRLRLMGDVAGASMSYKREVFERYGGFIEGTYCSDTEFHWRLARNGQAILFDPSILVEHASIESLPRYLAHEFAHGRFFARVRGRFKGFSRLRKTLYGLSSPFIFPVVLARTVRHVFACRTHRLFLWKALPGLTLGIACWCAGEAVGYVDGLRRSLVPVERMDENGKHVSEDKTFAGSPDR
jgi:GT2 family glycosyltransferase